MLYSNGWNVYLKEIVPVHKIVVVCLFVYITYIASSTVTTLKVAESGSVLSVVTTLKVAESGNKYRVLSLVTTGT